MVATGRCVYGDEGSHLPLRLLEYFEVYCLLWGALQVRGNVYGGSLGTLSVIHRTKKYTALRLVVHPRRRLDFASIRARDHRREKACGR